MNIEAIHLDIILVVIIVIAVAGWAFALGKMYAKITEVSLTATKTYQLVAKQDERIDQNEKDIGKKLDAKTFNEFLLEYTTLKTQHNQHHKE